MRKELSSSYFPIDWTEFTGSAVGVLVWVCDGGGVSLGKDGESRALAHPPLVLGIPGFSVPHALSGRPWY